MPIIHRQLRSVSLLTIGVLFFPVSVLAEPNIPEESLKLKEFIKLPEADLERVDIATMNLACAEGLPGSEEIDRKAVRETLDRWAQAVAAATLQRANLF